jgi:osmotically-inducible protein OsmY
MKEEYMSGTCKLASSALALAVAFGTIAMSGQATNDTRQNSQNPGVSASPARDAVEDRIEYRLETDATLRKYNVDVDVDNNVATLTGEVATATQKEAAARLAKTDGITRVDNKITVDPDADKTLAERARTGLSKAGETINDGWITTKVKWFFVGEDALDGSDINVDTSNHVVTLKGTVTSEAGRARAKALAQQTEGVKDVKDELRIAPAR